MTCRSTIRTKRTRRREGGSAREAHAHFQKQRKLGPGFLKTIAMIIAKKYSHCSRFCGTCLWGLELKAAAALLIFFLPSWVLLSSAASDGYFTAAVYEHVRLGSLEFLPPKEMIAENLQVYALVTQVAAAKGADILVFPEYGILPSGRNRQALRPLLEEVPDPQTGFWNPCLQKKEFQDRPVLFNLSCMAREHGVLLVANMGGIQPCNNEDEEEECPPDGAFHFNTDVAFDQQGRLLARYHKMHLFFEVGFDVPPKPEYISFATDFGVFGLFTCFDILFWDAVQLIEKHGVTSVIFPTWWYDELPLLSSIQMQEAWALMHHVNLLASNIQYPIFGSLGSGIYSSHHGALTYTHKPDGKPKLLLSRLPIRSCPSAANESTNDMKPSVVEVADIPVDSQLHVKYYYKQSDLANYTLVKLTKPKARLKACNNQLCCTLAYVSAPGDLSESYFLAVFNGTFTRKGGYRWCEESCLLVRCNARKGKPCARFPTQAKTKFLAVALSGTFSTRYVYPSVLATDVQLLPNSQWSYSAQGNSRTIWIEPSEASVPILTVGLYGRCYDRDPPFQ